MTLKEFFKDQPKGAKSAMAEALKISRTWLSILISGREIPSAELTVAINRYTKGKVSKKSLRPDLFG